MTAKVALLPGSGSARDLRRMYHQYASAGLLIAVLLHGLVITGYYLVNAFEREDEFTYAFRTRVIDLGLPPSIMNAGAVPQVQVSLPAVHRSIGIPVPVPDAEVRPDATIPTQVDLSKVPGMVATSGDGDQVVVRAPDLAVDDPDPAVFIPVEQIPVPVRMVKPIYPEIARRAGIEGKVLIRMLVTKEGKVKKSLIEKSDADVFDDPALTAAAQWLFTPAMTNNGPIAVWVTVPFKFLLAK